MKYERRKNLSVVILRTQNRSPPPSLVYDKSIVFVRLYAIGLHMLASLCAQLKRQRTRLLLECW